MTAEISNAAEFKAAVARTDITPPLDYKLWGYSDRKSGATAVLDPLFARVLVLDDGSNRLALVTEELETAPKELLEVYSRMISEALLDLKYSVTGNERVSQRLFHFISKVSPPPPSPAA